MYSNKSEQLARNMEPEATKYIFVTVDRENSQILMKITYDDVFWYIL